MNRDAIEALIEKSQIGDIEAEGKLIEYLIPEVKSIVIRTFKAATIADSDDLLSAGLSGLRVAIIKFDKARNIDLMTFAGKIIKIACIREYKKISELIRVPLKSTDISSKYSALSANASNIEPICLTGADGSEYDHPECIYRRTPEDEYINEIDHNTEMNYLFVFIRNLKEPYRYVILHRYGLFGSDKMTLRELRDRLDVSPETVRRIQNRGIELLKESLSNVR